LISAKWEGRLREGKSEDLLSAGPMNLRVKIKRGMNEEIPFLYAKIFFD